MGLRHDSIRKFPVSIGLLPNLITLSKELTMRAFPYYHHRLDPQVRAAVINGEIPQYPQLLPSEPKYFDCLKKICELCWNHDLEKRVDMSGVLRFLQSYIQNTECSEHSFPHYQEQCL